MQKLILAAIVAYLLLPEEFAPKLGVETSVSEPVSAQDALGAAQDAFNDVGAFCERNKEACNTGKALISGARQTVLEGLNEGSEQTAPIEQN